jgi:hypothetical protein
MGVDKGTYAANTNVLIEFNNDILFQPWARPNFFLYDSTNSFPFPDSYPMLYKILSVTTWVNISDPFWLSISN